MADKKKAKPTAKKKTVKADDAPRPSWRKKIRWRWRYLLWAFLAVFIVMVIKETVKVYKVNTMTAQELLDKIAEYRAEGRIIDALELLTARRIALPDDPITEELLKMAPNLEGMFFFELSRRMAVAGDLDEAAFWALNARTRITFETMLCSNVDSSLVDTNVLMIGALTPGKALEYLKSDPANIVAAANRVLEWDEKYPPSETTPFVCNLTRMPFQSKAPLINEKQHYDVRRYMRMELHNLIENPHLIAPPEHAADTDQ